MVMKKFIMTLAIAASAMTMTAQDNTSRGNTTAFMDSWNIRLSAGLNFGGTAPLPLPREIRAIEGYCPGMNLSMECTAERSIKESPWGIRCGIRLERKGMTTKARTKNYHMEAWNTDGTGKVQGAWTGKVRTTVSNTYLTLPAVAVYHINSRWNVSAGAYVSYLLKGEFTGAAYDGYIRDQDPTGEKADVIYAQYDFSDSLRRFNWGLQAGGEYRVRGHVALFANLQWGMNGIFPSDFGCVTFEIYPIYGTLGVTWLF